MQRVLLSCAAWPKRLAAPGALARTLGVTNNLFLTSKIVEILALLLIVGALWGGYKVGCDAAKTQLLEAQSQSIRSAISSDNEFFQNTGLHGSYLLEGHEYRSPTDYVIVKYSDLEKLLHRVKQGNSYGNES